MCTSSIFREAAQHILSQAALASMAAEGGAYGNFWPMIWDQNLLPTLAVPPGSAPQPATGFSWFGGWRPAYGLCIRGSAGDSVKRRIEAGRPQGRRLAAASGRRPVGV